MNSKKLKPVEIVNGIEMVKLKSIILVKIVKINGKYLIDDVTNALHSWEEQ